MVDAPNWGQDWNYVMRDNGQTVLDADTQHNTVLSIHMYDVFNTAASINAYLDAIASKGWPLVIGEFGWQQSPSNVDHETLLAQAVARNLGYLGWSWAGNNDPYLDMATNFDPNNLSTWGQRIFNGANGIKATAKEAGIYAGGTTSPTATGSASPTPTRSPSTSPSAPGGGKACTAAYSITGQWPGGFQGEVKVTAGTAAISGWTVTWTFANGQAVSQAWSATVTSSGAAVTARNVGYNGTVGAGASTTFGFIGSWTGSNNAPAASCTAT
jgi:mannan endo-1,4-beta-mannosidase